MYNFGDKDNSRGSMKREVQASSLEGAKEQFRTELADELAAVLGLASGEVLFYSDESIPYRQGWFVFGGSNTEVLYVSVPTKDRKPTLLRSSAKITVDGKEQQLNQLYTFIVSRIEEVF